MAGERPLLPGDFFALRAPALPFAVLVDWADGVQAPAASEEDLDAALDRDRALLRQRLGALLARPEVREAMFVASPDLEEALAGKLASKGEPAAVRYLQRMAARATPFGLFSGNGVAMVGDRSQMTLPPASQWRRNTSLDCDYLDALSRVLAASDALRDAITVRPNTSLHRQGEQMRYVEVRLKKGERSHHLVEVTLTQPLGWALEAAGDGARVAEIGAALVAAGLTQPKAEAYVRELIEAQLLVPSSDVQITGEPPLQALLKDLAAVGVATPTSEILTRVRVGLREIDDAGLGVAPERYRAIAAELEPLGVEVKPGRLFTADLTIPLADASLARSAALDIARGIELLRRLAPPPRRTDMEDFRRAFWERYDEREVPLLEALDDERGIGYGRGTSDPSPLLDGIAGAGEPPVRPFGRREQHLLGLLEGAWRDGAREIALAGADVQALANDHPAPTPDALAVFVSLARTVEGPRIVIGGVSGPSGARLLGRFCHGDPQLESAVRRHLRAEESLDPDACFAEIVHLPSGRLANVLIRPVLRAFEIEWLGRSGAPRQRRLPAGDLLVSVRDGCVVLRSRRLDRRVVPRLTSAHNWNWRSPPLYRFMCELQYDAQAGGMSWSWEPFDAAPFLPRVRSGQLVLSRARWRITKDELRELARDAWRGAQSLRTARGLPRWVLLADADNRLPVDFENVLSVEAFARLVRPRGGAVLEEMLPGPGELIAEGPDGPHVHELIVPFVREPPPVSHLRAERGVRRKGRAADSVRRNFPPGSEWTYLKLYGGTASLDRLLRDEVGPLAQSLVKQGAADRWFFLRYTDPEFHLRIRWHGDPRELRDPVEQLAARALESGAAHDVGLGAYRREIERYGGPDTIELAERIFHADSDTVVDLLAMFSGGREGMQERWQIGLLGTDRLMRDLGMSLEQRLALSIRTRDGFESEYFPTAATRRRIGERYREHRASLTGLLELPPDAEHPLAPGIAALDRRSERLAPIVTELRELDANGGLSVTIAELHLSYAHMWLNRLSRSSNRTYEWVTYDLLSRLYRALATNPAIGDR